MQLEIPNIGIGEWLYLRLIDLADEEKIAQIFADDGSSWTFSKLLKDSVHTAVGLTEIGVKFGDNLSLVIRNSHELYAIVIGSLMAGIRICPSIAELSADDLATGFSTVKPTHVLTAPKTVPTVEEAIRKSGLNPPPKILALDKDLYTEIIRKGSHVDPENYKPAKITDPLNHSGSCYFSSGTTGPPKAVSLSNRYMLKSIFTGRSSAIRHDGPQLNISQCNWVTWTLSMGRCLHEGRTRVFMDQVDIKRIMDAIQKYKVETWFAPPRILLAVEKAMDANPGVWDISSLKLIVSGGDSLKDAIQDRLAKKFNVDIYQEYGSTEAGFVFYSDCFNPVVLGSVGKPRLPLKLVDTETGETIIEPNKTGELYTKEPLMIEYVGNERATKEAFDNDGWLKTGDLMYFDENGNYFMVERVKEIFKYNGYQVAPSELEVFLTMIPEVIEVAVVGKKDPSVGEYPTAFIVKRPGSKLTEEDVHNFLVTCNLPDWKKLRGGVIFIDQIPKTGSGKVAKRILKEIVNKPENKT